MRRFARRLCGQLLLAVLVASQLVAQSAGPLRLDPVASYGWTDLSDSTRPLSVTDRRLQAGELGSVNGAVEGRNGEVFVLDPVNKKVAVFDRNGVYLHAFGGDGEGPGEFRRPSRITNGPDGSIYVWDPQLKRVSQFSADGKNLSQRTLPTVPNTVGFTVANNRAWFVRLLLGRGLAVRAFDLTSGMAVDSFAPLTENEVSISGFGAPGSITSNTSGEIIYAGPFPITLRIWSGGKMTTAGTNRFPAARGVMSDAGVRNTPVSMRGIAVRPDGSLAAVYSTSDITPANFHAPLKFWLEILAPNGRSLGKTELQKVDFFGGISATANGDLLLSVTDEYPQVRRVRVAFGPKTTR